MMIFMWKQPPDSWCRAGEWRIAFLQPIRACAPDSAVARILLDLAPPAHRRLLRDSVQSWPLRGGRLRAGQRERRSPSAPRVRAYVEQGRLPSPERSAARHPTRIRIRHRFRPARIEANARWPVVWVFRLATEAVARDHTVRE